MQGSRRFMFAFACAAAPALAGCHDTAASVEPLAICDSPVIVTVDSSARTVISWSPTCAATAVRVDLEADSGTAASWSIAAAGAAGILPNVAYGEARSDAVTQTAPAPLRTGFAYRATVFGGASGALVTLGQMDFRPQQHAESAFQIKVAMPDTVFGRATGISFVYPHSRDATLFIDEGTGGAQVLTSATNSLQVQHCSTEWDVDFPSLPNGRHNFRIDVLDSAGHVGSMTGTFVVSVPQRLYHLTFLGGGADSSDALGINQIGTIAGWTAATLSKPRATLWRDGRVTQLESSGEYSTSRAVDVNDNGVAALMLTRTDTPTCHQGAVWTNGAVTTQFGGRCDIGEVTSINDSNVVIGAYVYSYPDGRILPVNGYHNGRDINDKGQIVGRIDDVYSGQDAAWTLNITLPGLRPHNDACSAPFYPVHFDNRFERVNELGQAIGNVGYYVNSPFLEATDSSLVATPLGAPTNVVDLTLALDQAFAVGLNDEGLVVGFKGGTVYLWSKGRTSTVQLDDSTWRIDAVADVDNTGRIVGRATNTTTGAHGAVLLTPAG
jgi:hypothetical protein